MMYATLNTYLAGAQTTGTRKGQMVVPSGQWLLEDVRVRLETAPTGSTFLVDVNRNGTTLFSTQGNRPTVAAAANAAGAYNPPSDRTLRAGDALSFDIDQVGSTVAGSDLTVTMLLRKV